MKTDVVELADTLLILCNLDLGISISVAVQQVGSGGSDRGGSLDGFSLDTSERELLGLTGFGSGRLGVEGRISGIEGAEVGLDGPWAIDSGLKVRPVYHPGDE